MSKNILVLLLALIGVNQVKSQYVGQIVIGTKHSLRSNILDEESPTKRPALKGRKMNLILNNGKKTAYAPSGLKNTRNKWHRTLPGAYYFLPFRQSSNYFKKPKRNKPTDNWK